MQLSNIAQFLEVYKKKLFAEEDDRKAIREAILRVTGVEIPEETLTIKQNTVYISGDSTVRNHLFLYKAKILEEIKKVSPKIIVDVR